MDSDARHIAHPARATTALQAFTPSPAATSPSAATGTLRAPAPRRPPAAASTACAARSAPVPAGTTTTADQAHPLTGHSVAPDTGTDHERR